MDCKTYVRTTYQLDERHTQHHTASRASHNIATHSAAHHTLADGHLVGGTTERI